MMCCNGLLFDIDGTMVDTDALHLQAYRMLLAEHGRGVTENYYLTRIMGAPLEAIFAELFPDLPEHERRRRGEWKEELFRGLLNGPLAPKPGLHTLVEWAKANGWGICAVTNAPRDNAKLILDGLGLFERIDHLLVGDELPRAKPDPYPYAEGLRRLGIVRESAVAFEDSGPGIRSASAAGIHTFGMRGALGEDILRQNGAADVIADFTAPKLWAKLDEIEAAGSATR